MEKCTQNEIRARINYSISLSDSSSALEIVKKGQAEDIEIQHIKSTEEALEQITEIQDLKVHTSSVASDLDELELKPEFDFQN